MEGFRVYIGEELEEVRACLRKAEEVRKKALSIKEEMQKNILEFEETRFFFLKRKTSITEWQKACEPFIGEFIRYYDADVLLKAGKITGAEKNILKRVDAFRVIAAMVGEEGSRTVFISPPQEIALNLVRGYLEKE